MKLSYLSLITAAVLATPSLAADTDMASQFNLDPAKAPAQNFDLSKWKINLPELTTEGPRKGKTLEIAKSELANVEAPYVHPEWFYTDKETGAMVFVAPNTAPTTPKPVSINWC